MACGLNLDLSNCTSGGLIKECNQGEYSIKLLNGGLSGNWYIIIHAPSQLSNVKLRGITSDAVISDLSSRRGGCVIIPTTAYCYRENDVGPYLISEVNPQLTIKGNELWVKTSGEGDYCDTLITITSDPKGLINALSKLPKPLPLLYGGFFEDGLIWALVKAGYVKESELPGFIKPRQAYYWVRGDVANVALTNWVESSNAVFLDILVFAYEELLNKMNEYGGVKIPYITAARAKDIYGSPQQSYVFNTLLRGFELTGDSRYLKGALKALECYNVQPPNCLGYIDLGNGLKWFRWGSRHFLSSDPQGWENLMVLNTHLMAVLSFSEAYIRGLCSECIRDALSGVEAIVRLSSEFQRSDGYLYYSLYSKAHMGEGEDDKYPPYRGYSLLSSRLALKSSIYLNNNELYDIAKRACLMGYSNVINGKWSEYEAVARCLSLLYLKEGCSDLLNKLMNILRIAYEKGVRVIVNGYGVEDALYAQYQPAMLIQGNSQLIYVGPRQGKLLIAAYSREASRIKVRGYGSLSGHEVKVRGISIDYVNGEANVSNGEVTLKGEALISIDENVVKPAMV
ncbi:hypothetical protein [Caldivirga sp. UBA161]|uniref:hypothetical protein n=1 Tax=Caldivirga sp. UBA161 TaxID=1915569 RepID=UPI0025C48CCF|nr:hypothetical protein [Caldivirga sp. UBA161]